MAKSYEIQVSRHPSIYEPKDRKLNIYYSEPDLGIDENTGILLLIAGFSGHANSKVYQKMRNLFADEYNLLTVQCDYFGYEFMQNGISENVRCDLEQFLNYPEEDYRMSLEYQKDIRKLKEIAQKNHKPFRVICDLSEDWSYFNDLGLMQAIDNLTAVLTVIEIAKQSGHAPDAGKIVVYGHSHGAYLAHLCNAFAPSLFSLLIDNSAWILPEYLKGKRELKYQEEIVVIFDYLVRQLEVDEEIYHLKKLYRIFMNQCPMIAFHGVDDKLVSCTEKKRWIESVPKGSFYVVNDFLVDKKIFFSTEHGLDADFLEMFRMVMAHYPFAKKEWSPLKNTHLQTSMANYEIWLESGLPRLFCHFHEN